MEQSQKLNMDQVGVRAFSLITGLHAVPLWLDPRAETLDRPQNVWQERCEGQMS